MLTSNDYQYIFTILYIGEEKKSIIIFYMSCVYTTGNGIIDENYEQL